MQIANRKRQKCILTSRFQAFWPIKRKRFVHVGKQVFVYMPVTNAIDVDSWQGRGYRQPDNAHPNNLPKARKPYQQYYNRNAISTAAG